MKKLLIILCVLALSVSVLAVAGCGNDVDADAPDRVVERFLKAAMEGDADTAYNLLSKESRAEFADRSEWAEEMSEFSEGFESYKVGAASISADTARVPVEFVIAVVGMKWNDDVILLKEDGAWKVHDIEFDDMDFDDMDFDDFDFDDMDFDDFDFDDMDFDDMDFDDFDFEDMDNI